MSSEWFRRGYNLTNPPHINDRNRKSKLSLDNSCFQCCPLHNGDLNTQFIFTQTTWLRKKALNQTIFSCLCSSFIGCTGHFISTSASFVWVTLPQARVEQLACVVKLLMGTREDMRMSREPFPLCFFNTSSWSTVAQRWHATGNACFMLLDCCAVIFYTLSETWRVHTFTFMSGVWPLLSTTFSSSEFSCVC